MSRPRSISEKEVRWVCVLVAIASAGLLALAMAVGRALL